MCKLEKVLVFVRWRECLGFFSEKRELNHKNGFTAFGIMTFDRMTSGKWTFQQKKLFLKNFQQNDIFKNVFRQKDILP